MTFTKQQVPNNETPGTFEWHRKEAAKHLDAYNHHMYVAKSIEEIEAHRRFQDFTKENENESTI